MKYLKKVFIYNYYKCEKNWMLAFTYQTNYEICIKIIYKYISMTGTFSEKIDDALFEKMGKSTWHFKNEWFIFYAISVL